MAKIIDRSIEAAEGGQERAPVVNLARNKRTMEIVRRTEPPQVGESIVRIINDCDPIGFLDDIVNGKAIQCHIVEEDGNILTVYETPGLNKRIEVAKFLAERFLPKVAVVKHAHLHQQLGETPQGQADTRTNFEQMVTHAANASPSDD